MKKHPTTFGKNIYCTLALASLLAAGKFPALGATKTVVIEKAAPLAAAEAEKLAEEETESAAERNVIIKSIELADGERTERKDLPWLGVSLTEADEALTAQLKLDPGVGLVVTYVAPDSPAAKAGLQKHDVLVEFQDQSLVVPAQLRKLVQARKEGDTVKLKYYRAGQPETVSATLAKAAAGVRMADGEDGSSPDFHLRLFGKPLGKDLELQMKSLKGALGDIRIDQQKVQEEVQRSMERARKSYHDALRQFEKSTSATDASRQALEELARSGVLLDNKARVTVRSTGKSSQSMVKTDESGTIVIVANPKPHLTVHDPDGKLIFDGPIESDEQRAKVPKEVWEKVEPLLSKLNAKPEE